MENHQFQIFRGLAYIHAVPGVCHRDVKPQNLLVCLICLCFFYSVVPTSLQELDYTFGFSMCLAG